MKKILALLIAMCLILTCSGCTNSGDNDKPVDPDPQPEVIDAEITMENFVKKLEAGNYVIDAKNYVKTTAVSPEQVYFIYNTDLGYDDYAFVTLKGETFEGTLDETALSEVMFITTDNAIEALTYLLPNYWMVISVGNMFNLFYNNVDNPLEFTSYDENVKTTLLGLGGYGQLALSNMEEVHMVLDQADPTSVRFTAVINDIPAARIYYDDLDLTIKFGVAESDPRIEKWIKDPVYPATRTSWTRSDINTFELLLMRGYGKDTIPFPSFTSYALVVDDSDYMSSSILHVSDAHATEEDVQNYIQALVDRGYEKTTVTVPEYVSYVSEEREKDVYRLLLREKYNAYVELYPYYDDGFNMDMKLYYDNPVYEGLAAVSEAVQGFGFPELSDTDNIKGWGGVNTGAQRSEGWAYYFIYDMYMLMNLDYKDYDAALAYCEAYGNKLMEKGFAPEYTPDSNGAQYKSPNSSKVFRYSLDEEGKLVFEFRSEKEFTPEEARKLITDAGIPDCELHGDISAREVSGYYHEISGFEGLWLNLYQPFASSAEAESFLDNYTAILEENGYYYTNPQAIGSYRSFLYLNEEAGKYVAFDLNRSEEGATIFFEFVSFNNEDESILSSAIRY